MPLTECLSGQTFSVGIDCEDRSSEEGSAPSTLEFRIDDITIPTAPVQVQDWTSLTADDSTSVALASDFSDIIDADNQAEIKQITVTADRDLTFESSAQASWIVKNQNSG